MYESPSTVADEILELLKSSRDMGYFGEQVTQLAHALQCAQLARESGADDETIIAALLHDVGHICADTENERRDDVGVLDHDQIGANYLRQCGFSPKVIALVEGHVEAKRYLTATNPAYLAKLSAASVASLELQGGPMNADEVPSFESDPLFTEKLRLRSWDEMAKQVDCSVPPLPDYRSLLVAHLNRERR